MDYNHPPDFKLQTPPYYRPASSVTLTCESDGVGLLRYQWSSTCSTSCFASDSTSNAISTDILKSNDAGEHTCTVTDAAGHTGSAVTAMRLMGKYNIQLTFFPTL